MILHNRATSYISDHDVQNERLYDYLPFSNELDHESGHHGPEIIESPLQLNRLFVN